jgi:SpoVK/Ycf46/Vps4 family AAA+-type ATPase
MRAAGRAIDDEYRGLYVSEAEARRIVAAQVEHGELPPGFVDEALALVTQVIEADERFRRMVTVLDLSTFDAGCVLLALASESDLDLERLLSHVQDDVTKKRPRLELAVRLLAGKTDGTVGVDRFLGDAPLRKNEIVRLSPEPGQPETPILAHYFSLDPRVAAYLMGHDSPDDRLAPAVRDIPPGLDAAREMGQIERTVDALAALPMTTMPVPVVAFAGPDQGERLRLAERLAEGSGLGSIVFSFPELAQEHTVAVALVLATREAALQKKALVLDDLDQLAEKDHQSLRDHLRAGTPAPLVVLSSRLGVRWPGLTVQVPGLDFDGLVTRWRASIAGRSAIDDESLRIFASKFRLDSIQVADATDTAIGSALGRNPGDPNIEVDDLYAAARMQSTPILNDLAKKIAPHYNWESLILPDDAREQLREICAQMEHRHRVLEEWGLGRRMAMGKGLTALFAGNSGTGKTMAADVIAGSLGLDLYKIDLSGVVSKYIGETEKNLSSIFREAETSNAILFFDEADALFGKRSEVKDAHDRYANIETAYLLQRMEEYSGIVILATNLKMNLDEAFLRRLTFVVDFPMPEQPDRLRIWESIVSHEMPLADDVDIPFMARQFKIAGGNIRNIVLAAAYLAADEGSIVAMHHFIRATRREYQKLGRMVTDAEFGPYVAVLRG